MNLASLVDKPLMQNPLAGGAMTSPQESQLQGDPLVQQMQMRMQQRDQKTPGFLAYFKDVMDTKGYPTKTMQEYESQFPGTTPQQVPLGANISNANFNTSPPGTLLEDPFSNITAPGQIPDRYKKGFEEFYKQNPDDYMRIGGQAISYVTTPQGETIQFGDTGGATNFRRYLESIGETPRDDSLSLAQGSGPLATMEGQTPPGFASSTPNPIQTGGLGDQGLMDRLTSLEQGIGSLQNQIASLFQTQQASDPFGLGGFINTRRY